jgi:hypothetical protein
LSDAQLDVVAALACKATTHLEECAARWGQRLRDLTVLSSVIVGLMTVSVEELADGVVPVPGTALSD